MSFLTKLPRDRYDNDAFAGFAIGSDFTLGNGKALAWMSQLAYETDDADKMKDILGSWGLDFGGIIVKEVGGVLPIASTHCFVAGGRGATFVAFAGTDPVVLANWITDFDAHIGKTETAQGFQVAADAVWPDVEASMKALAPAGTDVIVTGHSLGGALAVLTASRLVDENVAKVSAIYTFGMPRPASKDYADQRYNPRLGSRTYRLVQGCDLVPTVAPSGLGLHHVGRYLHCERGAKFDRAKMDTEPGSDLPQFVKCVSKALKKYLHGSSMNLPHRLELAAALELGKGPPGMRTDVGGILIELLPPRLRDHMPDRYIGAF
jgi:Lipase (class 3)